MSSQEYRFGEVYRRKQWATGGVLSGDGSRLVNNGALIAWLDECAEQGLRTVVDLGCGDLEWISRCRAVTEGVLNYTGFDVVPAMIEHHRRLFPWFGGRASDLEELKASDLSADVVILKDVLPHHCNGFCEQMLMNLARADWKRLLVTTHPGANNAARRGVLGARWVPYDVEATGLLGAQPAYYLPRSEGCYAVWESPSESG